MASFKRECSVRLTVRTMREAAILVDQTGAVLGVSPAFEALCGWCDADLTGQNLQQLVVSEGIDAPSSRHGASRSVHAVTAHSCVYRRRGSRPFLAETISLPVRSEEDSCATLHILHETASQSRSYERLMELIAFMASTDVREDIDISTLLDLGCRYFRLDQGILFDVDDAGDHVSAIGGEHVIFNPGETISGDHRLSSMLPCDADEAFVDYAGGRASPPISMRYGLEALLACPLRVAERHLGVLCFASRHAKRSPFDHREKQVLGLIAQWLTAHKEVRIAWRCRDDADRRFEDSQERHRTLYEKTPAMLHSIDEEGRLASVSDHWLEVMGYERDEVIGRPSTDFLTEDSRRFAKNVVLPRYRVAGRCDNVAYQFVTKDGDLKDILLSATSEYDDDGGFLRSLAVLIDVTEQRQMRRALDARTMALERSNADLARFAQVASHDLQEPLRRIITCCDILNQDFGSALSDEASEIIDVIQSSGRRFRLIVKDLLDYVRISEQVNRAFEPVDLSAVIDQALDELDGEINSSKAKINIAHLPLVWGRAPLLKVVFLHLLRNAIIYGGKPSLRIDISVDDASDAWRFAIADRGPGIDAKYADRIFEIFQRLHPKEEREGSGMGLAICRLIIQRCGGEMWLDRTYDGGARFLFTLPKEKPGYLQFSSERSQPPVGNTDWARH